VANSPVSMKRRATRLAIDLLQSIDSASVLANTQRPGISLASQGDHASVERAPAVRRVLHCARMPWDHVA
jgi:hypothetical protein